MTKCQSIRMSGANPFFMRKMDALCAVCLMELSEESLTFTLNTPISAEKSNFPVWRLLESISKFKAGKGPDQVCSRCFHTAQSVYLFQSMCNQAQDHLDNYEETLQNNAQVSSTQSSPPTSGLISSRLRSSLLPKQSTDNRSVTPEVPEVRHPCKRCGKIFLQFGLLLNHIRTMHKSPAKTLNCNFCGMQFFTRKALNAHSMKHVGDHPYECLTCGQKFKLQTQYNDHMAKHTISGQSSSKSQDIDEQYKCNVCQKVFHTKLGWTRHAKLHRNGKQHTCDLCHKSFKAAYLLQRHKERTHK